MREYLRHGASFLVNDAGPGRVTTAYISPFYDVFGDGFTALRVYDDRVAMNRRTSTIRESSLERDEFLSKQADRERIEKGRERERERCRERAEERQRDQRGKEVARLSEVWVEGKSLTWSPKRSSLSFLGEFTSQFLVVLRLCHLSAWTPFLTRN